MIEFNINDHVSVRLTEHGRKIHRKRYDDMCEHCGRQPYVYLPKREDADGWSKWQLWDLMSVFGDDIQMSSPPPFETTIRIHTKNVPSNGSSDE